MVFLPLVRVPIEQKIVELRFRRLKIVELNVFVFEIKYIVQNDVFFG